MILFRKEWADSELIKETERVYLQDSIKPLSAHEVTQNKMGSVSVAGDRRMR